MYTLEICYLISTCQNILHLIKHLKIVKCLVLILVLQFNAFRRCSAFRFKPNAMGSNEMQTKQVNNAHKYPLCVSASVCVCVMQQY